MNYRKLGKTGFEVSEVSFGGWAIGGTWGDVEDEQSMAALEEAVDQGINFFDTADVYGDGRSERLMAKLRHKTDKKIYIATKAGRRLDPHTAAGYNKENLNEFVDRSLKNLDVDQIDLLQLHCPPTEVYDQEEVFEALEEMVEAGKIKNYGVSVEKVEEAMKALEYENVATVQIIFNMFRHKPADEFFAKAKEKGVGIICRVPLASGLLTGKFSKDSTFAENDHRNFNRNGEAFDKGETFSGVDFELGLKAVEELEEIKPEGLTMAQFALKWILMHDAVSCVIPGGKKPWQVKDNAAASEADDLSAEVMERVDEIYDEYIRDSVHHLW
ncbi:Aldo-keto reductase [Halanaerobium saccharolyticum subsp. saccharolyticum DSM 6643]|uniref:Aldo-keto reductase n=1 Tax=Halanaerobium saccharolyticum subsp. saccharolyticum DSM 6643 TaxID=1293054 RepID=M5DYP7_9FIRM|nr:aldo/keto reductase [Halanaerobium saccharolyticum]CCU78337.1 Aldo-keto reductase [Halanaerobium saccharolyticum subsp. saccharolyticum DSM 6643]